MQWRSLQLAPAKSGYRLNCSPAKLATGKTGHGQKWTLAKLATAPAKLVNGKLGTITTGNYKCLLMISCISDYS